MNRSPRKSAEQWAKLVDEYTNGELSERDFCARHDIKLASLRKWRYQFKSSQKHNCCPVSHRWQMYTSERQRAHKKNRELGGVPPV